MEEIGIDEVKILQLDILSALDRFCREKGIQYFIIDGTLLGAVRHKGYIPWDDDIDVGLVRSEYNRLMAEFPDVLEDRYELLSLEKNDFWDRSYAAIYDNKTVVKYERNCSMATGLLIDIFPIDEVPSESSKWQSCIRSMRLYNRLHSFKSNALPLFTSSPVKWVVLGLCKLVLLPFSQRRIAIQKSRFAQSYNGCQSGLGYELAFGVGAKQPFLLKDFESFEEYQFENRKFIGPKNYDSVLTRTYGDYMQLPPEDKRVSHHSLTAYYK
jgi:lipopolysaccharide cholinephosphotransferase